MVEQTIVYRVNAFSDGGIGGNGAGVVLQAEGLSDETMQHIAAEVGYSETAFVTTTPHADVRMRYFTPTTEVNLCGHATLAATAVLKKQGKLLHATSRIRVNVGHLTVEVKEDDKIWIELSTPNIEDRVDAQEISRILGIPETAITKGSLSPRVIDIGARELIVPIADQYILAALKPDLAKMAAFNRDTNTMGIHAFTLDTGNSQIEALCRNFSPLYGIDEDSASGVASGALGYYLAMYHNAKSEYVFRQGITMNSPAKLYVSVDLGEAEPKVRVGGYATIADQITINTELNNDHA